MSEQMGLTLEKLQAAARQLHRPTTVEPHPFWRGFYARERGEAFDQGQLPAWRHGWETCDEYLECDQ